MNYRKFVGYSLYFYWLKRQKRALIESIRLRNLRSIVSYAIGHSPFYETFYAEAGIKKQDVPAITLEDLPPTNKKLLMDNFNTVVTDKRLNYKKLVEMLDKHHGENYSFLNEYEIMHTSGTSGLIGIFPIKAQDLSIVSAAMQCFLFSPISFMFKKHRRSRVAYYVVIGARAGTVISKYSTNNWVTEISLFSVLDPLAETVKKLNLIQPDVVTGYASAMKILAMEQIAGRLKIFPSAVICSADPLYESTREIIKEAYGIEPTDCYSSTENLFMGYRHNESFFSILDPICYLGRDSTTNLYNKTFPIIKYQNEDLFEFIDDHTINPFTKIKLKNLRANDIITVINNYGEEISIKPYLIDCFEVEGMDAFQFCKMENNTLLIKISGKKEGLEKKGLNAAMDLLKVHQAEKSVKVKILIMDSIPLDPKTGKHRMVIP